MLAISLRYALVSSVALLTLAMRCSDRPPTASPEPPLRPEEKLSYAYGLDIGKKMRAHSPELDPEALARGLRAGFRGEHLLLTDEEAKKLRDDAAAARRMAAEADRKALADTNRSEGILFLAENRRKPGVETTSTGLQYRVLREGKGARPAETDRVKLQYRQRLIDGSEVDSSYSRGTPGTLPLRGLIPGWKEALLLMPVGSHYEFTIPSHLAYGERGAGKGVGPNAVVLLEVELLGVEAGTSTGPPPTPAEPAAPNAEKPPAKPAGPS